MYVITLLANLSPIKAGQIEKQPLVPFKSFAFMLDNSNQYFVVFLIKFF